MLVWVKAWLRDHFGFSRAEANGVLVLLLMCCLFLVAPQGLKWYYSRQPLASHAPDLTRLEHTLKLLEAQKQVTKTEDSEKPISHTHVQPFDINTADEAQISTVKGIGAVLSKRIVKFRDKLGGFVSQTQFQEVYGLSPAVIDRLQKHAYISANFHAQPLNINTEDIQKLAAHPYLTYQQAKSIVRYREQHGPFTHIEALEELLLLDRDTLEKVAPYLAVQ